ncbi:MAG: branched-chain amino acid ABC transporter permease [Burkholderiales bacterium]|nr:branched-chain amino acid ABC transporter permease [Burkholderiales bacterium]MDE2396129.1 branched-chain amino acid ABC transporter permease [Burkholderiales bacterium]MDE2455744.1 branched-chain amino acid ABC transporter permease [Burkholderiales bacterium]
MNTHTLLAGAPAPVLVPVRAKAWRWLALLAAVALLCWLPVLLTERSLFGMRLSNMALLNLGLTQVNLMLIAMLGALSLNYLTGCAGLISIGHAAFYAVGAMTAAVTGTQWGWPFPLVLGAAALAGAAAGVLAGLPSLRVRGLYFVLSTFAVHYIVVYLFQEYQFRFFDVVGVPYAPATLAGWALSTPMRWYFFLLPLVALIYIGLRNTMRTREGRAMRAMRDHELAATAAGIDVRILRLKAFAFTSAIASVAGAVYAYYLSNVTSEAFGIQFAIQFIAMIIIGGMGSLAGSLVGAAVWLLLPSIITGFASKAAGSSGLLRTLLVDDKAQLVQLIFGLLVIVLLIFAPEGLAGIGRRLRSRFTRP